MAVVPCIGLVLNCRCVDSDTSRFLLGSLINIRVILELSLFFIRQILGDRCRQCRLPVINVTLKVSHELLTDGSNIQMLLAPVVLCEGSVLHGTEKSARFMQIIVEQTFLRCPPHNLVEHASYLFN